MKRMNLLIYDFDEFSDIYSLWSVICVKINDVYFPDDQWWDSTSDVLNMWIENMYRLICGSIDYCMLDFMDGDYAIKLIRQSNVEAIVLCIGPHKEIVLRETIDLMHFARQLLSAVGKMKIQYADHIDSRVIQSVMQAADKLRKVIKKHKQSGETGENIT